VTTSELRHILRLPPITHILCPLRRPRRAIPPRRYTPSKSLFKGPIPTWTATDRYPVLPNRRMSGRGTVTLYLRLRRRLTLILNWRQRRRRLRLSRSSTKDIRQDKCRGSRLCPCRSRYRLVMALIAMGTLVVRCAANVRCRNFGAIVSFTPRSCIVRSSPSILCYNI
jgi:hypothetical protein